MLIVVTAFAIIICVITVVIIGAHRIILDEAHLKLL
jgi:hypothetical protein